MYNVLIPYFSTIIFWIDFLYQLYSKACNCHRKKTVACNSQRLLGNAAFLSLSLPRVTAATTIIAAHRSWSKSDTFGISKRLFRLESTPKVDPNRRIDPTILWYANELIRRATTTSSTNWDKPTVLRTIGPSKPDLGPSDPSADVLYDEQPRATMGQPYSSQGLTDMLELSSCTRGPSEYPRPFAFYIEPSSDEYARQDIGYHT